MLQLYRSLLTDIADHVRMAAGGIRSVGQGLLQALAATAVALLLLLALVVAPFIYVTETIKEG